MEQIVKTIGKLQKAEFEARIFISLSLVLAVSLLSFLFLPAVEHNLSIAGRWLGWSPHTSLRAGYLLVALLMLAATILRMWAGSMLTSGRVMAFKVQHDRLLVRGPYMLVRNPIYLADFIAFFGFALCLKPVGLLLPILLYLHYSQLVSYEGKALELQFGSQFVTYKNTIPRFLPTPQSLLHYLIYGDRFRINSDGFRHNALYLLFIPGFIVSAITGELLYAILIGLPAVVDWAVVHTIKGTSTPPQEKNVASPSQAVRSIRHSGVFSDILYAQCWEDPEIDRQAFRIRPDDVIFSITSGGCNVLAFLVDNPAKIVALDLNPCQNHVLELKMAAFKTLQYDSLLEFLGILPSDQRIITYHKILRGVLNSESRDYWDQHPEKIRTGIIHTGRYEGYMHMLRKWFGVLMGKSLFRGLYEAVDQQERELLYREKWNNIRWRLFTGFFLSRFWMTFLFDKAFFVQLERSFSFGDHFRGIIRKAITELPVRESSFLAYILFGNFYSINHLPVYLRRENFEVIRDRLDRILLITGNCRDYFLSLPGECFSKFNFTNIFEWMSPRDYEELLRETIRVARPASIITYRNLLVPRSRPESLANCIEPERELSEQLHRKDLSFIYRAYHVEQIVKKNAIQS